MFNAGAFTNTTALATEEIALPFEDAPKTLDKMGTLMAGKYRLMPIEPSLPDPNQIHVMEAAGVMQSVDGKIEAGLLFLGADMRGSAREIYGDLGIPHGFGPLIDKEREDAERDHAVVARFEANPKRELLRILESEAAIPGSGSAALITSSSCQTRAILETNQTTTSASILTVYLFRPTPRQHQ